ncbi:MAG: DUF1579 family protein [Fimbriimonas ginsengisoli]|uniref:DUF1579 family protein n=1 Tax=Fimbriimonas ginsengisoli TaxID=1005039 RepID=A0A931LXE8_FIMGI|nr:DUF1579 family protein [Fimbriimonas ginsengisoli]
MRKLFVLTALAIATGCFAQENAGFTPPAKELKALNFMEGRWHGSETYWFGPKPMKAKVVIVSSWTLNKMYMKGDATMLVQGMKTPMRGMSMFTYDGRAKAFVGYWFDSMAPVATKMTGTAKGDTLEITGESEMQPGQPTTMRASWTKKGAGHIDFTMEAKMGDKWTKVIEGHYDKS